MRVLPAVSLRTLARPPLSELGFAAATPGAFSFPLCAGTISLHCHIPAGKPHGTGSHVPEDFMLYCAISFAAGVVATFMGLLGLVVIVGEIDERSQKRPRR
jgi:hypothetical protein